MGPTVALTYGNLTSLAGNDCPSPNTPPGVISLSPEGMQVDGTGFTTFCIPRPDLLNDGNRTLGTAVSDAGVRIIDLRGTANNCAFNIDSTQAPTGTASGEGVCGNGNDAAGFALAVNGAITFKCTCGAIVDSVAVKLEGRIAIAKRN